MYQTDRDRKNQPTSQKMKKTKPNNEHGGNNSTLVDLFAGAGGFSLGFQMAGFRVVGAVESDKWACETFAQNHPDANVMRADITQLTDESIVELLAGGTPFAVIGGPPCQGFSRANKGTGDSKDPRNTLFMEFVRVGRLLRPEIMVMENVPNLLKTRLENGDSVLGVIESTLKDLGYFVSAGVLKATDFGVPQIRSRLFVVATRKKLDRPLPLPTHALKANGTRRLFEQELQQCPSLWEAISDLPRLNAGEGAEEMEYGASPKTEYQKMLRGKQDVLFNHKAMSHTPRMVERFAAMKCGDTVNDVPDHLKPRRRNSQEVVKSAYDQNNRRLHPHAPCHTIPASFYANFVHPFQHRNFTAREGARLQSFPDDFRFLGKPTVVSHKLLKRESRDDERYLCQYNQIGNAVPPLLARAVAANLIEQLGWPSDVRSRRQPRAERAPSIEVS